MKLTKNKLSVLLSKLKTFEDLNLKLEQYQTDSEIAAEVLWIAFMNNDIKDKVIGDLGCGNGVLGLGALILGAKKVYFIDVDKKVLEIAKENKKVLEKELNEKLDAIFMNEEIKSFNKKVDVVIENPPFGVKEKHADKEFLIKAMDISNVVYSFHKIESEDFIEKLSNDNGFIVKDVIKIKFPIKSSFKFHRKKVHFVDVGCFRLNRKS
jgi:putative methylase|tara:strand:+ start:17910 stop:18536 length:627 start_codon:yes stop_codon:yes gene_type:complete